MHFFFNKGFPPNASSFLLKNKLKSPAKKNYGLCVVQKNSDKSRSTLLSVCRIKREYTN